MKPKNGSLSQYELLWSQKAAINQDYETLFKATTKVETFVKIRHDGAINPRFKFTKLSDTRLETSYYNIDGYIEPTDLTKLKTGEFQKHIFGPFSGIFVEGTQNLTMATEIFQKLRPKLDRQEELFFIGYGTSGSGKTASLIYLSYFKDGIEITQPGVLEHFSNLLCKEYFYTNLEVTMVDFFLYFANKSNSADTFLKQYSQVKPILIDGQEKLLFTSSSDKKWILTSNPSKALGTCINQAFDSREVDPTSNNVDSSRSHVLVFLKFTKRDATGKTITQSICVGDLAGVENVLNCPKIMNKMDVAYGESKKWKGKNIPIDPVAMKQVEDRELEKFLNKETVDTDGKKQSNSQHAAKFKVRQVAGAKYEIDPIPYEIEEFNKIAGKTKEYFGSETPDPKFPMDYSYNKCSAFTSIKEFYNPELSPEENIKLLEAQLPADMGGDIRIEIFDKIKTAFSNLKPSDNSNIEYTTPKIFANEIQDYLKIVNNKAFDKDANSIAIKEVLKLFGFKPEEYTNMTTGKFSDPKPAPKSAPKPAPKPGSKTPPTPTGPTSILVLNKMTTTAFDTFLWKDKKSGELKDIFKQPNQYQNKLEQSNVAVNDKKIEIKCKILRVMKLRYNCELRKTEGFMINRTLKDMRIDIEALVKRSTNLGRNAKNLAHLRRSAENTGKLRGLTGQALTNFIEESAKTTLPLVIDNNVHPYCRNTNMSVINPYKKFYKPQSAEEFRPEGILIETIQNQGFNLANLNFVIFTVVHVSQTVTDKKIPVNNPPPIPFISIINLKNAFLSNDIANVVEEIKNLKQVLSKYAFYQELNIDLLRTQFKNLEIDNYLEDTTTIMNVARNLIETIEANNSATTLGTLYATDILRNPVDHPYSCMINPKSEQKSLNKYNPEIKLIRSREDIDPQIEVRNKYLKYKNKYLALKEKLRNRQ